MDKAIDDDMYYSRVCEYARNISKTTKTYWSVEKITDLSGKAIYYIATKYDPKYTIN